MLEILIPLSPVQSGALSSIAVVYHGSRCRSFSHCASSLKGACQIVCSCLDLV